MSQRDYAAEAVDALAPIRQAFEDRVKRRTGLGLIQPDPVGSLGSSDAPVPESDGMDVGLLSATFDQQLKKFLTAAGKRVSVSSGKRSTKQQEKLWAEALKKYKDPEVADNYVARPGTSNHERGVAADLHFADDDARAWAHTEAAKYGLYFPMGHEPWHVEPVTTRSRSAKKK